MKITILGCGTSSGVPRIGGDWGACDPAEPRNRRRRASVLVEHGGTNVVIDTGPDFRMQMLDANVQRLDAVLLTHGHADHCHGIDDVRQFFHLRRAPVACFASAETWADVVPRFAYVFDGTKYYPPAAVAHPLPPALTVGGMTITAFDQIHGAVVSSGFRIDAAGRSFAYSTDVKTLPPSANAALQRLDLWVVDGLREAPHPTHSHLTQTLGWIATYAPTRAVLTHMDQSLDYQTLAAALPAGVEPGYDGLTIDL